MAGTSDLTDTLEIVEEETNGAKVTLGEVFETLNHRGFGALLMLPALLAILVGAIPGVPALSGIVICFITAQIIAGRHFPWLPGFFKRFSFSRRKLTGAIAWAKPYARKVDSFIRPRLPVFLHPFMQHVVAACCFVLGLVMVFFGFIPFLPALVAIPVLFFGLGASSRDGCVTLAGFGFMLGAAAMILWLSGAVGGGEDRLHIGEPVFIGQGTYSFDLDLFAALSQDSL